jgi:ComF family protein
MNVRAAIRAVLDFCYPGSCAHCDDPTTGATPLCEGCLDQLRHLERQPACTACAMSLAYPKAPCPYCKGKGPVLLERLVRLAAFEDPLKTIIHKVKYHRLWPWAEYLADRLLELEPTKELLTETDVLVPVPLHPIRQIERGYNQAAVIAGRLGRKCGIAVSSAVVRLRHTETQTHMHAPSRREENLREAFAVGKVKKLRGKHVVLVDDVYTTGATLRALARAVREAQPASISAIVLAVAEPRARRA